MSLAGSNPVPSVIFNYLIKKCYIYYMEIIKLNWHEIYLASSIGLMREISNLKKELKDKYGFQDVGGEGFKIHINGACGEAAVAKYLGIYWNGALNNFKAADVGALQVRTRTVHYYDLMVHPKDKDDEIFILVICEKLPLLKLIGWIYGHEAKKDCYWKDPAGNRPAYFVPQSDLYPMNKIRKK